MGNRVMGIALAITFITLSGCLPLRGGGVTDPGVKGGDSVPVPDPAIARRLDSLARVSDSLRAALARDSAEADAHRPYLAELAAKMRRLPIPMGTRYDSAPRARPKGSAAAACVGERDIIGLGDSARGLMGIDTMSFFDVSGKAHCARPAPALRETHGRYLFDAGAGEARETLVVEITEDDRLPRYLTCGTGTMRLFTGLEFAISLYEVDMILDNATAGIIIQDAKLRLAWKDGYALSLGLARPKPYRAPDLFPIWESLPTPALMMSGPITKGDAVVGYADLFADRTVAIRDRNRTRIP